VRAQGQRRGVTDRLHDEAGVSLVEVLVAVLLLTGAFMALSQVATTGLFSLRSTADRTTAMGLATQAVEAGRLLPWDRLALDEDDLDPQCGTLADIDRVGGSSEPVVCSASGGVNASLPYWGQDGRYELETYVTSISGYSNARRVTAVVRWQDRGQTMEIRNSNVVAAVERG
jgi:Tfp pilus assembly protein PilV